MYIVLVPYSTFLLSNKFNYAGMYITQKRNNTYCIYHGELRTKKLGPVTRWSMSRTMDVQRGNSLHWTAENSLPLPNF